MAGAVPWYLFTARTECVLWADRERQWPSSLHAQNVFCGCLFVYERECVHMHTSGTSNCHAVVAWQLDIPVRIWCWRQIDTGPTSNCLSTAHPLIQVTPLPPFPDCPLCFPLRAGIDLDSRHLLGATWFSKWRAFTNQRSFGDRRFQYLSKILFKWLSIQKISAHSCSWFQLSGAYFPIFRQIELYQLLGKVKCYNFQISRNIIFDSVITSRVCKQEYSL